MAYESLEQEYKIVKLGGIDKTTGKKNPTQLEGYYLGFELRPNKFNPQKPQHFFKFQTQAGLVGTYGNSAGMVRAMRNAVEGCMTKLVDTGETLDTGKGNPMRVFKAWQDKANTIDVSTVNVEEPTASDDNYTSTDDIPSDDALFDDEQAVDEIVPPRPVAPKVAPVVDHARQAKLQAMLAKSKTRTA